MKLIIDNHNYSVGQAIGSGGEAEVYCLNEDYAVKTYYPDVINNERRQKVLGLCNAHQDNIVQLGDEYFAFPQHAAYENQAIFDAIVGFSMPYFKTGIPLSDLNYDLNAAQFRVANGHAFDDQQAIEFIYAAFDLLERLHKSRIILGDVNQNNILCDFSQNKPKPIFIDLDSAQFGAFFCAPAFSEDFIDPFVVQQGKNPNGSYMYSSKSDVFSLACIAYQLFCGANPFHIRSRLPLGVPENKQKGISTIRCCRGDGVNYLHSLNVEYIPNEKIEKRIGILECLDKKLADFFIAVFVKNERDSLVKSLPVSDPRNPKSVFYVSSGAAEVIAQEKKKRLEFEKKKHAEARQDALRRIAKSQVSTTRPDTTGISNVLSGITHKRTNSTTKQLYSDPSELTLFLKHYGIDHSALF